MRRKEADWKDKLLMAQLKQETTEKVNSDHNFAQKMTQ